ncbi:MAG: T9SS type A sorting domain-containing protein [Lewinellaceae bacterium]|nr:T9SS type A sorting domain-containing protein [Saprospiraceae bacterium]MCB9341754.1 T9SS type A sorting domain-containing protein [Lewinellaceae bacterium]
MKKLAILFIALLGCAFASGQDEIWINPNTAYAEADATATEIEAVSSIYNASGFELYVDWQWNTIELPPGWSVEFCENNGCFPSSMDTIFSLSLDETAPVSAIFHPNGIPGTGKVIIRLYSASPGIHIEERLVFVAVATGPNATVENEADAGIALFPNPARQVLNLVVEDPAYARWQIVELTGQQRLGAPIASNQVHIECLPPGLYIFQALTAEGGVIAVKRFVKI